MAFTNGSGRGRRAARSGVKRVTEMERLTKPYCSSKGCYNCSEYALSITKEDSIMLCEAHMEELRNAVMVGVQPAPSRPSGTAFMSAAAF